MRYILTVKFILNEIKSSLDIFILPEISIFFNSESSIRVMEWNHLLKDQIPTVKLLWKIRFDQNAIYFSLILYNWWVNYFPMVKP